MAGFVRTKRVSDPLDARVRDRLVGRDQITSDLGFGYASSGSEHSGESSNSPCLSELVHGFLEEDDDIDDSETRLFFPDNDSDSDRTESVNQSDHHQNLLVSCSNNADPYRNLLAAHVAAAASSATSAKILPNTSAFRRSAMAYLRDLGYNAAICKTRWEASPGGGVSAGSYEFIDIAAVGGTSPRRRYFVDLDFASEFQIARPSPQYCKILQSLPRIFVGDGEDLRRIVRSICEASKKSMRSTDLSLPPWRKNRYMQAKWFGPYRRTTNLVPEGSFTAVKSRCVGFDNTVSLSVKGLVRTR